MAGDGLRSVSRSLRFRVAGLASLDPSWHDLLRAGAPGSSFYGVDPSYLPSWPPGVVRASGFLLVSAPGDGGAFLELPVSNVPRGAWFDRLRFYSYTPPGGWRAVYEGSWDMSRDPPVFSAGVPGPWAVGFFGYGPASGPPSVECLPFLPAERGPGAAPLSDILRGQGPSAPGGRASAGP